MDTKPSSATSSRHRVLIVEDHPVVRQGLKQLVNQERDLEVCGEAESAAEALAQTIALRPELVLVDIGLKGSSGLELLRTLQGHFPALPVLVMSMHDETLYAERVLRLGARGYIMKQEATEQIIAAMHQVLCGEVYVSARLAGRLLQGLAKGAPEDTSPLARLSDRELEVFRLLGQGQSTRQVAATLNLSVKTVETHRAHIMDKLQLAHATELIQYATRWTHGLDTD